MKLWNGKHRRIHVRPRNGCSGSADFIADDAANTSPVNIFFLDGKEVYRYNERTHYYYSDEINEEQEVP